MLALCARGRLALAPQVSNVGKTCALRCLATEAKKKKRRHPGGRGAPEWKPDVLPPMDFNKVEERMSKLVEKHVVDLSKFRSGAASSGLINHVKVKVYGAMCELQSVARVFKQNDSILNVQPYDPKTAPKIIEGITNSELGLNPTQAENNLIKIVVPKPTKELRQQLTKSVKLVTEENRNYIRSLRSKAMNEIKLSLEGQNEDMKALGDKEVHAMYTETIDKVNELTAQKVKDIMS